MEKKEVPKIGKEYYFYDDGKLRPSRQFRAKVVKVITPDEAKSINVEPYDEDVERPISLYDYWQLEAHRHVNEENFTVIVEDVSHEVGDPWLFSFDTDYFVECLIPGYDDYTIWFVRHVTGGWHSLDIQNGWQGGLLDVDGSLTKSMEDALKEYEEEYGTK